MLTPPTGLPAAPENPDSARAVVPPAGPGGSAAPVVDPCVCRHAREAHEHWRRGTDCGICGVSGCARYRRQGGAVRRFLRRLHLVR